MMLRRNIGDPDLLLAGAVVLALGETFQLLAFTNNAAFSFVAANGRYALAAGRRERRIGLRMTRQALFARETRMPTINGDDVVYFDSEEGTRDLTVGGGISLCSTGVSRVATALAKVQSA